MRVVALLLIATVAWAQDAPLDAAAKKMEEEDYAGAVALYGKAIEGAPGDARGYAGRAEALQMLDKHAEAIKDLTKAIELAPKSDGRYRVLRAFSYVALDDHDAAIADCAAAIGTNPRYSVAYRIRGEALVGKRDYTSALADFDKALEIDPSDIEAVQDRGDTREALRDYAGAIEDYTQLTRLAPDSPAPFLLRAYAETYVGSYEDALADLEAVFYNEDPEHPDKSLHVTCARVHLALGHKEAAEAELAKAGEAPAAAQALAERGRYFFDTDRPKEAAAELAKAVQMDPKGQDYTRFFLFLARARLGERPLAAGELKTYLDRRERRDDWYAHVAGFLCGDVKESDLFAAATSTNPRIAREQECEASWYAAAVRMLDGDAKGAKPLLERCIASDVRSFIEYESAKAALAAMSR